MSSLTFAQTWLQDLQESEPLSFKEQIAKNQQEAIAPETIVIDEVKEQGEELNEEKNEIEIAAPVEEVEELPVDNLFPVIDKEEIEPVPSQIQQQIDLIEEPLIDENPVNELGLKRPVPLVLWESALIDELVEEEVELCEDDSQVKEPWTECDDKDTYTKEDVIWEDGCTCAWEIPPIEVIPNAWTIQYDDGYAVKSSVTSIDVVGWWAPWCSMIARLNLKQFFPDKKYITGISWPETIAMGDAVTLIQDWISSWVLSQVQARDMQQSLDNTGEKVHDLFIYTPRGYSIDSFERYLQGHRAVIFQADDLKRYVLDPLRGYANTVPQPLREYVYHYTNKEGQFYLYTRSIQWKKSIESDIWFEVDPVCEIWVHNQAMLSSQFSPLQWYQENQVCFDVIELCQTK